jgi:holo-[acyl-carrier protein] synthase
MATVGVGIDIVDVARFTLALERHPAIAARLFTNDERRDACARPERLAARFAAKEAVLKTLSAGLGAAPWHSIEIRRDPSGAPCSATLAASRGGRERQGAGRCRLRACVVRPGRRSQPRRSPTTSVP